MNDQKAITQYDQFKSFVRKAAIQERFEQVLKDNSEAFLSALLSIVADNKRLQACTPDSILTAALKAAILNLPIEPALGMAYIVPFKDKATFIIGYRGLLQLAYRTNWYKRINTTHVYEGESIKTNRLTGELEITGTAEGDTIIGAAAYFKTLGGLEKALYMDYASIIAHAEKYSPSYRFDNTPWHTETEKMQLKTVLRLLLSRWGLLSITQQDAQSEIDEAAISAHVRILDDADDTSYHQERIENSFPEKADDFDMFGNIPDSEVEGETPIEDMGSID